MSGRRQLEEGSLMAGANSTQLMANLVSKPTLLLRNAKKKIGQNIKIIRLS